MKHKVPTYPVRKSVDTAELEEGLSPRSPRAVWLVEDPPLNNEVADDEEGKLLRLVLLEVLDGETWVSLRATSLDDVRLCRVLLGNSRSIFPFLCNI